VIEEEKNLILKEEEVLKKKTFVINVKKQVIGLMNAEILEDQEKDLIIVVEVEITITEEIEEEDIAHLILEIEEEIENIMIEEESPYLQEAPLDQTQDLDLILDQNLDLNQTHHQIHQDRVEEIQSVNQDIHQIDIKFI